LASASETGADATHSRPASCSPDHELARLIITCSMLRSHHFVRMIGGQVLRDYHQLPFASALVAATPQAITAPPRVDPSSGGTFPVSTYLVSHDLANPKSLFSRPSTAMIPSMDAPAPPAFLSVSFHTRMASRKREQDCRTSVTPMASDVSCSETANKDNLEMSLFPLLEQT